MDSLWPKTKWDLDTTPGSLGSFFCHTFDPEFFFWVLLPLAVLPFSGDMLSEATHAIGSGDSSVRVWQSEWRTAVPGELSWFQTGTHSCHCLAQRRWGCMGLGANPSSVPQHLCHLEQLFSPSLMRDPDQVISRVWSCVSVLHCGKSMTSFVALVSPSIH